MNRVRNKWNIGIYSVDMSLKQTMLETSHGGQTDLYRGKKVGDYPTLISGAVMCGRSALLQSPYIIVCACLSIARQCKDQIQLETLFGLLDLRRFHFTHKKVAKSVVHAHPQLLVYVFQKESLKKVLYNLTWKLHGYKMCNCGQVKQYCRLEKL